MKSARSLIEKPPKFREDSSYVKHVTHMLTLCDGWITQGGRNNTGSQGVLKEYCISLLKDVMMKLNTAADSLKEISGGKGKGQSQYFSGKGSGMSSMEEWSADDWSAWTQGASTAATLYPPQPAWAQPGSAFAGMPWMTGGSSSSASSMPGSMASMQPGGLRPMYSLGMKSVASASNRNVAVDNENVAGERELPTGLVEKFGKSTTSDIPIASLIISKISKNQGKKPNLHRRKKLERLAEEEDEQAMADSVGEARNPCCTGCSQSMRKAMLEESPMDKMIGKEEEI